LAKVLCERAGCPPIVFEMFEHWCMTGVYNQLGHMPQLMCQGVVCDASFRVGLIFIGFSRDIE
jgi:hypothetical protein